MTEEGSESSVATSSSTPNWKDLSSNSLPTWANMNPWNPTNQNSNSSCEEDISISNSFTNASNRSSLSIDNSSRELVESSSVATELSGEPAGENHLWSQVLLSVGTGEDLRESHDVGENFLQALSSKHLSTELFDPAYDYLKKLDNSWEFTNQTSYIEKQLNNFDGSLIEPKRLPNSSDLVSNWSIAPPNPQLDNQITPKMRTLSLNSCIDRCLDSSLSQMKQEPHHLSSYSNTGGLGHMNSGYFPCYEHHLKGELQHQDMEASESPFLKASNGNCGGYQLGVNNSVIRDAKGYYGMQDASWANSRAFTDLISFGGRLNQPLVELQASKPCLEGSNSPDSMKQGDESTSTIRGNGRGTGITSESKKKRSESTSDNVPKKPKHESSAVSSSKIQAPKVKLGDRITALQQIVSPFGKVNTYIHMYTRYESTHLASLPYHNSYTVEFILLNPTSDVLNGEDCSYSPEIFRHITYNVGRSKSIGLPPMLGPIVWICLIPS
eukprot:TRINITY_DN4880_c0_g1_i3.p1 TRINITY_DN4880_c0_g1~~TRINITY_DN4880_c0_g1_i3.p1  ORF type:complete len:496 (+),score=82.13 TRINITY_DN4880_c0_g1_i3:200-1687(+)